MSTNVKRDLIFGHLDPLRDVAIHVGQNGLYRLQTWDTGKVDHHMSMKSRLAYRLTTPQNITLFEGEDFCCSPSIAVDSDECLRNLLVFLRTGTRSR